MPDKPTPDEMAEIIAQVDKSNRLSVIKEKLENSVNYCEPIALTPEQCSLILGCMPWYEG